MADGKPNILVIWGDDNGPHMNTWPDAGMTPFRSEKNTNREGAFRVPQVIRWPGKIPAGVVSNEIVQHHDGLPTFLAAAGEPDIVDKLKAGHEGFKVHMDPFERADVTSNTYWDWHFESDYIILAAMTIVANFLETFKEFPPRQKAASFTIDQVVAKLESVLTSGR